MADIKCYHDSMGALLFQSSKRDEQNKERKMDENNVNGFNDMDDDEDEGTTVLTTPGVSAFSPVQDNAAGQPNPGQSQMNQPQQNKHLGGFGQPMGGQYGGFGQPQYGQQPGGQEQPVNGQYGGLGQAQYGQGQQFGGNGQPAGGQYGGFGQPQYGQGQQFGGQEQPTGGQYGGFGQAQYGQGQQFGGQGQQPGGYDQPVNGFGQQPGGQYGEFGQSQYGQPQYGQPQYGQPQYNQQPGMTPGVMEPGKKVNKKLIAIIGGIAAAVLIAIIVVVLILSGGSGERSAKKVGDKLVTAYENGDADAMVDLMDKEYYKLYNRIRSYTGSDDYVKDTFNEQVSDMVDEVGKVKSIKVKDRSEKEYDEDKLKDVNDTFDMLNVDMTVDKCYEVDLDVKIKGSTDESDGEIIYTVIKTGGKWYLVDYDLYVY